MENATRSANRGTGTVIGSPSATARQQSALFREHIHTQTQLNIDGVTRDIIDEAAPHHRGRILVQGLSRPPDKERGLEDFVKEDHPATSDAADKAIEPDHPLRIQVLSR